MELVSAILARYDWAQKKLAEVVASHGHPCSESDISRWINGKREIPNETLPVLREIYRTGQSGEAKAGPSEPTGNITLPVVAQIPHIQKPIEALGQCQLPNWVLGGNFKDCYVLQLKSDALSPRYNVGDYLVIRRGEQFANGDVLIMDLDGKLASCIMGSDKAQPHDVLGVVIALIRNQKGVF